MKKTNKSNKFKLNNKSVSVIVILLVAIVGSGLAFFSSYNSVNNTEAASETGLPFSMPSQQTLKSSPKKVYAHYFTPYPIRIGGASNPSGDYYETGYLNPSGEGGIHLSYGGYLRDKPLFYGSGTPAAIESRRTTFESGLYQDVTLFEYNDMKEEINRAVNAGLDGFIIDMLTISDQTKNSKGTYNNSNFRRMVALLHATQWYNQQPEQIASNHATDFKIMLMPDGTASATSDSAVLASTIAELKNRFSNALVYENGKLVISPFYPENKGVAYWTSWLSTMKNTYKTDITFIPCFINMTSTVRTQFKDISYGYSVFNTNRSKSSLISDADKADADGKLWMQSHAYQDTRPKAQLYQEANNTEVLRDSWEIANTRADWIQLVTWNDYSENTQFTASESVGHNLLDLTAYYVAKYKTGVYPSLLKDNVYLIHRLHNNAQNPNGSVAGYTDFMEPWSTSRTPRDKIEVLTFLKQPSTLNVSVGSNKYTYNVPAGVTSTLVPMSAGTVSAEIKNNSTSLATVTSPWAINNNFAVQDVNYHMSSAFREGVIKASTSNNTSDLNNDSKVDIVDLSLLLGNMGKSGAGDIDNSGTVDIADLSILISVWSR